MHNQAVERVTQMEQLFDRLLQEWENQPITFWRDEAVQSALQRLLTYYEGGQWLADYLLDKEGGFPADLKRGVLSQDGVWNFLCDIQPSKPADGNGTKR